MKRVATALVCAQMLVVAVAATTMVSTTANAFGCLPSTVVVDPDSPPHRGLDAEQQANAAVIAKAVVARRLPTRAAVIAVATALQESSLRNLPYGDRDSLGLFQQRPSQGWGGPARVMDPVAATNAFLDRLVDVQGWPRLPLTVAAQVVQRSAFPDAYARWEPQATALVSELLGRPAAPSSASSVAADLPGLFVLADGPLGAHASRWPRSYQGGEVVVFASPTRTAKQGERLVARRTKRLPSTVVVGLGPNEDRSPIVAAAQLNRLLKKLGDRTVYWIDNGTDPAVTTALHALTPHHPRLRVLAATDDAAIPTQRKSAVPSTVRAVDRIVTAVTAADPEKVATEEGECADGLGGYQSVPVADCGFATSRPNPRTCADSIRWALAQADQAPRWERKCLHFVARANGWSASGVRSAADYWAQAGERHLDDPNPPAGALVFWDTGKRDGHVALSVGNGTVVSTDIAGRGTAAAVALTTVSQRWNATYLGWAPPFFPHGV